MIEIYPPGSSVFIRGGALSSSDIKCKVIAVSIAGHEGATIRYEIAWVVDSDRKTAWIESFEIVSSPEHKTKVGFKAQ